MSKKNPDLRMANIVDLLNRNCDKNDGSNHQRKEKWRNYNMIFFFRPELKIKSENADVLDRQKT